MLMVDRINALAKEKGISISKVEKTVGLSNGVIGKWIKQNPTCDKLKLVADFFGVSLDYLVYGEEDTTKNGQKITDDEQELLENYRKLDDNKKKEVSEKIKVQSDNIPAKNEIYEELSKIITSLPLRERSKLIAMIYDCEEQYHKYGSMQIPQATDLPVIERQLLNVFRQFNGYEQAKVLERIKEWLDVKHRREQINKQKIVGIQIARRNDGTSSGQMPLTAEEAEKIAELPEETNF